jgi:alpha-amylase
MAIGLLAWGRFETGSAAGTRVTVPAPPTHPWLADFLHAQAASLGRSFDYVQWPPWSKAEGGAAPTSDGYGVFDRRDLGTKPQQGSIPTRYGPLESTLAAIAALNAHGCRSIGDLVMHQMSGENGGPGVFRYLGADGKTRNGRGATTASWFRGQTAQRKSGDGDWQWVDPVPPFRPQDDVPVPADDSPFGRELCYQKGLPEGVAEADAKDYVRWLHARTGAAMFRFDDTKGTYAPSVRRIMDAIPDLPFYSEYFDGNPDNLNWWATSAPMSGRSAVADFTLHWRIQAACNGFDARELTRGGAGYFERNPGLAVGFVDNPDTDTSDGQQVISNKGLAYAYLLTLPLHLALVYGKDYFSNSVWPGAYGLRPSIDNLCWISRMFAFGNYQVRWVDRDVFAATRNGNGGAMGWSGGLLTALNFNTFSSRTITCDTTFGPNRWLHDYSGHHTDVWTDRQGRATFTLPSNAFARGESYVCFAPGGVNQPVASVSRSTTQVFEGDSTLDVMPAGNGTQRLPQRIYCASGSRISLNLTAALTGKESLTARVDAPDNTTVAWTRIGVEPGNSSGRARTSGWHSISIEGHSLPANGCNYKLAVTYTGAETR